MSMKRRSFLRLLGVSSAAAVVEATRLVPYAEAPGAPERDDEGVYLTRLALRSELGEPLPSAGYGLVSGFLLDAPSGRQCRAEIYPTGPLSEAKVAAYLRGARSLNHPGEVIIDRVTIGTDQTVSITAGAVDAAVFNTDESLHLPVDWGCILDRRPLVIDYHAGGFPTTAGVETEGGPLLTLGLCYDTTGVLL